VRRLNFPAADSMNRNDKIKFGDIFQVPNLLSISRILLTPVIGYFLWLGTNQGTLLAVIFMVIAGLTDYFDGVTARWLNKMTKLGLVLDPVADKIFIIVLIFELIFLRGFPAWLAAVIILRDAMILLGAFIMMRHYKIVPSSIISGKYYFASLTVLVLSYVIRFPFGIQMFLAVVIIMLILSSLEYAFLFYKTIQKTEIGRAPGRPIYGLLRTIIAVIMAAIYLYKLYEYFLPGYF